MSSLVVLSAVLLAGGRSKRMGTDKALLPIEGRLLWQRQWTLLKTVGAQEYFISARPEQLWVPDDVMAVRDAVADAGPLAGITAALTRMSGTHLLVLAVDLPRMELAWLQRIVAACEPGVGVVGRLGGFYEPLAAVYPRELCGAAEAALARGEYAPKHLIADAGDAMRSLEISATEAEWFANWNNTRDMAGDGV